MKWILLVSLFLVEQDQEIRRLWRKCGSEIQWIKDEPPQRTDAPRAPSDTRDRSELWKQALAKAKETNKPILLYLYRIDGRQMYRAACLDNYMQVSIFTDPDIVSLVNRRFVPVKLLANSTLPLNILPPSAERDGKVEPAIVFVKPNGEVFHILDRIRTFNPDWFDHVFRLALAKMGMPEELKPGNDPYENAVISRRLRDAEGARAALAKTDKPEAAVERALLLLKERKLAQARTAFDEALQVRSSREPEARYYRAFLEFVTGNESAAYNRLRELGRDFPESPWAWRGAAELSRFKDTTPEGPISHYFFDPFWGPLPTELPATTGWARGEKEADEVARRAIDWLVRHQRSNGCFDDTRYAFWDNPKIIANVKIAATAVAAAGMLDWRELDPGRVDRAVSAAEKYIFDESNFARHENEEVYADLYRIVFLSRKLRAYPDRKDGTLRQMEGVVEAISKQLGKSGFWSHEYPNPFVTAAVVQALSLAPVKGSEELVKKGAAALKGIRAENGAQPYGVGRPRMSSDKDSSGRIAMSEAAIFLGGLGPLDNVKSALDVYWKYYPNQEKVRLCDFHTDGELGGFFFLHNMFHTTEAVKLLPAEDREKYMIPFRGAVVALPEIDGSFLDDHEIGKSYGTGMGLLIMRNAFN